MRIRKAIRKAIRKTMTAQVFRNGQQQTFYVSDALTPAPGGGTPGLNAAFQNLTVSKATDLGAGVTSGEALMVRSTVQNVSAIEIQGAADNNAHGLVVTQLGHSPDAVLVAFGANTLEANQSGYVFAYGGMDLKFGAGLVEQLRLKNTGIAANSGASSVLALQPGSTTIFTNTITSGVSSPVWATLSGWTAPATVLNLNWQRVGNTVSCWGAFSAPSAAVGANVATITLPVARTSGPFTGAVSECLGVVNFQRNLGGIDPGNIAGNIGSSTAAVLTVTGSAPASAGTIRVSFAYQL